MNRINKAKLYAILDQAAELLCEIVGRDDPEAEGLGNAEKFLDDGMEIIWQSMSPEQRKTTRKIIIENAEKRKFRRGSSHMRFPG